MRVEREYRDAIALLAGFRSQRKTAALLVWFLTTAAILMLLTLGLVLLERLFPGSTAIRQLLYHSIGYSWLLGVLLLAGRGIYDFLWRRRCPSDLELARELGIRDDQIRDRLLNALQLHSSTESHQLYSPDLIDQALVKIVPDLPRDTKSLIPRRGRQRSVKLLLGVTALLVLLILLQGNPLLQAFDRLRHYDRVFVDPGLITVRLTPGDTTLIRGDDLLIQAFPVGTLIPATLQLAVSRGGENFIYPLRRRGKDFTLLLERVHAPFLYYIIGERLQSDTCQVEVRDRPVITDFQVSLTYPAYTGLLPLELEHNIGSFSAVYSSTANFTMQASTELTTAQLVLSNGDVIQMSPVDTVFQAHLTVTRDLEYYFHLADRDSLTNMDPLNWQIIMVPDSHPVLTLASPRDGERVTRRVPFLGSGIDDYGITRFQLRYKLVSPFMQSQYAEFSLSDATAEELSAWSRLDLPFTSLGVGEALLDYSWDLRATDALPEDEILLFVLLWDNDTISGPKWTRSPLIRINLPGTAEMYLAVESDEDAELERAHEIVERSRENLEELQELMTELRVDPERLDWETQRQLENIIQEQLELAQSAETMQENLEQLKQALEENQLFSAEVVEKLQKLTELLQELMTEEMKELLRQLQDEQPPTPEELQAAMEKAKQELDAFLEQMEQLLSILEQLQMEQKLEELARLAEELRTRQEQLNEQADAESPPVDLGEQQARLADETEALQEAIEQAEQEFGDNPHFPSEQLMEASEFISDQELSERMQSNAQQMESDPAGSLPQGEQLASDLGQLQQMLQDASDSARMSAMADLNAAIDRVIHRLLVISLLFEQQQLDVTGLQPENSDFGRCAFQQLSLTGALVNSLQDVTELMMQSFFISRSVLTHLRNAAGQSTEGVIDFEERRLSSLAGREARIMGGVNAAIYALMQNQEQMNAAESATGFQEMMEQLMQASSDQQCLNSQCQKLMSGQQGSSQKPLGISLSEMAREQGRLRQQMEQLSQQASEMSGGSKPLGDLGEIARQMSEVEEQLQNRQYTERTRKLQERILNQMLDSQRSVREKERSQERESRTATPIDRASPSELTPDMTPDVLRHQLMQALKEGYSREYLELVRAYYRRLMELDEETRDTPLEVETP